MSREIEGRSWASLTPLGLYSLESPVLLLWDSDTNFNSIVKNVDYDVAFSSHDADKAGHCHQ